MRFFSFGKWLFLATGTGYIGGQAIDKLIIAKMTSSTVLGVYSIAFSFIMIPINLIYGLCSSVVYPAISKVHREEINQITIKFQAARNPICIAALLFSVAFGFFGPSFFNLLYPQSYMSAGWMSQLLSPLILTNAMGGSLNSLLLALGDSRSSAMLNLQKMISMAIASTLGFYLGDFTGLLVGLNIATPFHNPLPYRSKCIRNPSVEG